MDFIAAFPTNFPMLSYSEASAFFACDIYEFLIEMGIDIDPEKVKANCLKRVHLNNTPNEHVIIVLSLIRKRTRGKKKFLTCDEAKKIRTT